MAQSGLQPAEEEAMTPSELSALEALTIAATSLPWTTDWRGSGEVVLANCEGDGVIYAAAGVPTAQESADGEFAVAACNAIPRLIAEVRRLRARDAAVASLLECVANLPELPKRFTFVVEVPSGCLLNAHSAADAVRATQE
jgi:hypothetical protein